MAVEEVHERVRRRLVELVGMEAADWILDRPPGGWSELVTKDWLHLELALLEARFSGKLDALDEKFSGKFDAWDEKFEGRFDQWDAKFEGRSGVLDERFVSITKALTSLDARVGSIEKAVRGQTWTLVGAMTGLFTVLAVVIKL